MILLFNKTTRMQVQWRVADLQGVHSFLLHNKYGQIESLLEVTMQCGVTTPKISLFPVSSIVASQNLFQDSQIVLFFFFQMRVVLNKGLPRRFRPVL